MIAPVFKSFRFALRGLGHVVRYERNAKFHLLATTAVLTAGSFLPLSLYDWCWLLASIFIVWVAESINTSIEKLVDLVSPEYNEKAGTVKDIAAGSVLLASIFAATIGGIILYKNIFLV